MTKAKLQELLEVMRINYEIVKEISDMQARMATTLYEILESEHGYTKKQLNEIMKEA